MPVHRRLMHRRAFDYSYQAFTADGAQWLVDNTDIALIGIDYLSIAIHDDLSGPHDIILGAVRNTLAVNEKHSGVRIDHEMDRSSRHETECWGPGHIRDSRQRGHCITKARSGVYDKPPDAMPDVCHTLGR